MLEFVHVLSQVELSQKNQVMAYRENAPQDLQRMDSRSQMQICCKNTIITLACRTLS